MSNKRVLVVGDSCEDVFVYGFCERICPDYPVPVFVEEYRKVHGGMAANVFLNVKALLPESQLITNTEKITKTRFIDSKHNHMFLRVDSGEERIKPLEGVNGLPFTQYDAVVISDYNKGFLTTEMIREIAGHHPHVFLDTKKLLEPWYKEIPYIKINEHEFERSRHLITTTDNLIITQGNKGCAFRGKTYPVPKVEVVDTVGAGDTFIAALACKFVETQGDIEQAIRFANLMATDAVQKRGIYVLGE